VRDTAACRPLFLGVVERQAEKLIARRHLSKIVGYLDWQS
jgi:hypothetical protein